MIVIGTVVALALLTGGHCDSLPAGQHPGLLEARTQREEFPLRRGEAAVCLLSL